MSVSRLVRAEILSLKEREFVLAARGLGLHPARILFRHLIPNALNPVMVTAALSTGDVILAESALSFLGVGIQAPTPSWGNIVADGRVVLVTAWWVSLFPGIAIVVSVLAFNLLGDRLRDALDPRMRGRTAGLLGRMVGGPGAGTGSETDGSPRDAALASPSGDDD
jgi:peptide/nickel transport system permease protein